MAANTENPATPPAASRAVPPARAERAAIAVDPERRQKRAGANTAAPPRPARQPAWDSARLHIGAGRDAGVRAADLVGAMTNELGLSPRAIGTIEIGDNYSLVEVPERIADELAKALRETPIKGRAVPVKRHRER